MALTHLMPTIASNSCGCLLLDERRNHQGLRILISFSGAGNASFSRVREGFYTSRFNRRRRRVVSVQGRGRSNVKEFHTTAVENGGQIRTGVEIPVTCYQIIGVPDTAEKDEIVKSVIDLKNAEVEEGYTLDAVLSRQELLMDVRDKLLFEPEYAGNTRERIPPKASLQMTWSWLPGALCLLQEVGAEKSVLEFGQAALQHPDAKPYIHDILLSLALAECTIAKIAFEKNKVSQGFEALARAQFLLRSKVSLGKLPLLSQIEETLEELAPACTLELLGMPHTPENAERRRGAIAALHELLRQGLDVETYCRVQDWPCFLTQALNKLMATEIVDLLQWEDLAVTRRNKKSLESHNQRVVIDLNCFHMAMIAHIALGFSSKQNNLINKAKTICECLIASEGIENLKLEEAFCSFLLGQGSEAAAAERLCEIKINSSHTSKNFLPTVSGKEGNNGSDVNHLEIWLKDAVLGLFPDTRDCSSNLANFFAEEKRILRGTKQTKETTRTRTSPTLSHRISMVRPPEHAGSDEHVSHLKSTWNEHLPHLNSTRHLGTAVKQLAPANLQSPLTAVKAVSSGSSGGGASSVQLKRSLGINQKKVWESWHFPGGMVAKITLVTVVGCFILISFKLSKCQFTKQTNTSVLAWTMDPSLDNRFGPPSTSGNNIVKIFAKLLVMFKILKRSTNEEAVHSSLPFDDLLAFTKALNKRQMPLEEAESLVRQWQAIKAEALGPDHQIQSLSEILAEPMLAQWQALADTAKARSCFWRFVLLQLYILRAEIVEDGIGGEMAEIEASFEEAAELVDESLLPKNPNYYSIYKIRYILKRQYEGSWRFCGWSIQTPK